MERGMRDPGELKEFLEEDLSDALKGLFVGAVVWEAVDEGNGRPELCPFQKGIGMLASFVQARALYEFYISEKGKKPKRGKRPDDARACDFLPPGSKKKFESSLYSKYMDNESPANKRVFHLVYGRSGHAGGPVNDEKEHIKSQVLKFAINLRRLTEEFGRCVEPHFRDSVECALHKALKGAEQAAKGCNIVNPL